MSLSPPPSREKIPVVKEPGGTFAVLPQAWLKWFSLIPSEIVTAISSAVTWATLDKTGSNLTGIQIRKHTDLQNLNTASHTHPTQAQLDDLLDLVGGGTAENSDRIYARNSAIHRI